MYCQTNKTNKTNNINFKQILDKYVANNRLLK